MVGYLKRKAKKRINIGTAKQEGGWGGRQNKEQKLIKVK
jgi:hypothetical protein